MTFRLSCGATVPCEIGTYAEVRQGRALREALPCVSQARRELTMGQIERCMQATMGGGVRRVFGDRTTEDERQGRPRRTGKPQQVSIDAFDDSPQTTLANFTGEDRQTMGRVTT